MRLASRTMLLAAVAAVGLAGGLSAPPVKAEDVVLKMAVPDWPPTHIMKDLTEVGDDNATRGVVKFAVEKTSSILSNERKRLVALSEQCAKYPVGLGKAQDALKVIDATTGILDSIRQRL